MGTRTEQDNARRREHYKKHRKAILATNYAWRKTDKGRAWKHRAHLSMVVRVRQETFAHYGGAVCACCGETEILFLTLDHVNDDGARHRKELLGPKRGKTAGWKFYLKLRQLGYPPLALRVLCYNCNSGR